MGRDVQQLALAYLAGHRVMTVATVGAEGVWAAAVFYVNREFDIYFLSAGHTRHARNMAENGKTAVTIQEDYYDWPAIRGIQAEGVVRPLMGEERNAAISLYQEKYPFIAHPTLQTPLAKVNWYHFCPGRLYFIDNSLGLGHRDEIPLP